MQLFACGHTGSSELPVFEAELLQLCLLSGATSVAPAAEILGLPSPLTAPLLQERLPLGQMVPLPPQPYLRIKINHPVLFSCCAN